VASAYLAVPHFLDSTMAFLTRNGTAAAPETPWDKKTMRLCAGGHPEPSACPVTIGDDIG
jgi:hypothetical protein